MPRRAGHRPRRRRSLLERLEERTLLSLFTVDTFADSIADDGRLSLREAIIAANASPGVDTIELPAGPYQVSLGGADEDAAATGDLDITESVNLVGAGASVTIVNGGALDRVFHIIADDASDQYDVQHPHVKLANITITGGSAERGGGIYNEGGTTRIVDSAVSGNAATVEGAAYYNDGGLISFSNSPLSNNVLGGGNGQPLISDLAQLLRDNADDVVGGINGVFGRMIDSIRDAFGSVDVPVIGDQLVDGMQPMFDALSRFRTDVNDFFQGVLALIPPANGPTMTELFQDAMFLVLGPGTEGLSSLEPAVQEAFEPLALELQGLNLGLLQDGPDAGDSIDPTDIVVTLGEDEVGKRWLEFGFHLGQRAVIDLPGFDIGLASITQFFPDTVPQSDIDALNGFLDTFGFGLSAEHGIRFDLRWDARLGFGVTERVSSPFYLNSGATLNGLSDGDPVEEIRASIDVFAAPASEALGFAQQFADAVTTPNLRGSASLGLLQAEITDGTPAAVQITAPVGLPLQVLDLTQDFSADFDIIIDDDAPVHVSYQSPAGGESLPQFLAAINLKLIDVFNNPFPPVSFTLDFSPIDVFFNPGAPTTPFLVLNARYPEINHLAIAGAEEYNYLAVQYENRRTKGMGFGNNTFSASDGSGGQVLHADLPAPAEGISIEDPLFFLWVGGTRNGDLTEGATPLRISFREILNRHIGTLEMLRDKLQQVIQEQLRATSYPETAVTLEIDGDAFVLRSHSVGGAPAPMLTVTYPAVDQTRLSLVAAIDITNPDFNASYLKDYPNDQINFNRLTLQQITSADNLADVFSPVLKADAKIRLHVNTSADHLTGFIEQQMGISDGTLGLPELSFDFKLDASLDLAQALKGNGEDGGDNDVFSIDTLQFDNISLDVRRFLETVVAPVAQAAADALEPVLSVIGHSTDDPNALLNQPLPLIGDITDQTITFGDLLESVGLKDTVVEIINVINDAANLGQTVADFVASDEFVNTLTENGKFTFGGLELVMDPDSALYFPRTKVPVPIDLKAIYDSASGLGIDNFMRSFTAFDQFQPAGFSIDLFRPQTIFDMLLGQPFNIVSFGLPTIDADAGADLGFSFEDLEFNIEAAASFDSNLRLVYDSAGLERIVDAYRSGASPDWLDLLAGFAIQNNPDGFELGAQVSFIGDGSIGPIYETDPVTGAQINVFEAEGHVYITGPGGEGMAYLGLELFDPNNDGKLRLDELFDITDDFAHPENLFCIFDVVFGAAVNIGGSATVLGVDLGSGEIGLDSGDFSLQELLSDVFGLCVHDETPVLATEIEVDGQTVLRLNTGPFASARLYGDTDDSDGPAAITVTGSNGNILVSGFGVTNQVYSGNYARIIGTGGSSGDIFDLSGLSLAASISGAAGDDTILGGGGDDTLSGGAGDDSLSGGSGSDRILAGSGVNSVSDGAGDDYVDLTSNEAGATLATGGGNDTVLGTRHADAITAGGGNVLFDGGRGNDSLTGAGGDDSLTGGEGDDLLLGGSGNDTLFGGFGADTLDGQAGGDRVEGDGDDDVLAGGAGADAVYGGQGNDAVTAGAADTFVDGGTGVDDLTFLLDEGGHTGTLSDGTYAVQGGAVTPYYNVETLRVALGAGAGLYGQSAGNYILNIDGPTLPLIAVAGGAGHDVVNIVRLPALDQAPLIQLGEGDDRLVVYDTQRALAVSGDAHGGNGDTLIVDRIAQAANLTGSMTPSHIGGLGISGLDYSAFEFIEVRLGSGYDLFTVEDTSPDARVTIAGGNGDDEVRIHAISSITRFDGDGGSDRLTLVIPGNPADLPDRAFDNVRQSVEEFHIDNSANSASAGDWEFRDGDVYVRSTGHYIIGTAGADATRFTGGQAGSDSLLVNDTNPVTQVIDIDHDRVEIQDGNNVLSTGSTAAFTGFSYSASVQGLNGIDGVAFNPDGTPGRYVYTIGGIDDAVTVLRRESDGSLTFIQRLSDGQLGVDGLDSPNDIAVSVDGRYVYVASSDAGAGRLGAIAWFERIAETGRLVYRGLYGDPNGAVTNLAVSPDGGSVFATNAATIYRLSRNSATGALARQEERSGPGGSFTAVAVSPDGQDVFATSTAAFARYRLASGTLPASATFANPTSYTDVAVSPGGDSVYVTFWGGVQHWRYNASATSFENNYFVINSTNYTSSLTVAVDPDGNRVVVGVDSTTVQAVAPVKRLSLGRLTVVNEQATDIDGVDDPYLKVNGVKYDLPALDEGESADVAYDQPLTGTVTIEAWEESLIDEHINENADLVITTGTADGSYSRSFRDAFAGSVTTEYRLTYTVYTVAPPPPSVTPLITFTRNTVNGTLSNLQQLGVNPGTLTSIDTVAVHPASEEIYGTNYANDRLTINGAAATSVTNGDSRVDAPAAASGDDAIRTVINPAGTVAYSVSPKYGVVTVHAVSGGVLGSVLQSIPAGLFGSGYIALAGNRLYVTNPREDSLFVYTIAGDGTLAGGVPTQVFTDNVNGVDGLDGAAVIAVSDDSAHVYVGGAAEDSIAIFSRSAGGDLTYAGSFAHAQLDGPAAILVRGGTAYVASADNDRLLVLSRNAGTGALGFSASFVDGSAGVTGLNRPVDMALSADGRFLYVAAQTDEAITIFSRDTASGELAFVDTVENRSRGVHGLDALSAVALGGAADEYLFAGGGVDTLTVFRRDSATGRLTPVQRLREASGGVTGIEGIVDLFVQSGRLYVTSGAAASNARGVTSFSIPTSLPTPAHYLVYHQAMESLTVTSSDGSDIVDMGEVKITTTLDTGSGADVVVVRNTAPGRSTTIRLGDDPDTLDLLGTGAGSTVHMYGDDGVSEAGDGEDTFNIYAVSAGSATTIEGNGAKDTFMVKGGHLGSTLTIHGNNPGPIYAGPVMLPVGDTLLFDAHGLATTPVSPGGNTGLEMRSVRIDSPAFPFGVDYYTIEAVIPLASPLASAGGPYAIAEGEGLTLSASASLVPGGHSVVSYEWAIGTAFGAVTGASPTLTWAQLRTLGITDGGQYQVSVRLTTTALGQTFSDIASAQLTVANTPPALNLAGPTVVEAGSLYTLSMSASDPGDDTVHTWYVDWGDGTTSQLPGAIGVGQHRYASAGSYTIGVRAADEDGGPYAPATTLGISVEASRWIAGAARVDEGSPYALALVAPTTACIDAWIINWGDGTVEQVAGGLASASHVYANDGAYEITARTIDAGGDARSLPQGVVVAVDNVAPSIDAATQDGPVLQGQPVSIAVAASDPGILDVLSYEFDFDGDGRFETRSALPAVQHVFTAVGTFDVALHVLDDGGGVSDVMMLQVVVDNAGPSINDIRIVTAAPTEARAVTVRIDATDPGVGADPLTYEFDFDNDGVFEVSTVSSIAQHTYPDNGSYPVPVRVTDSHGASATGGIVIDVANVDPIFTPPTVDGRAYEGTPFTLTVRATDQAGAYDPLTYEFDFDNDGVYDASNATGVIEHSYPDDGVYTVGIRITDGDGGEATTSTDINVRNVAPVIAFTGDRRVDAGDVYTLSLGDIVDPGDDAVSQIVVRWGDGEESAYSSIGDVTHVYDSTVGEMTIHVLLVDEDGTHPQSATHTVFVSGTVVVDGTLFIVGDEGRESVHVKGGRQQIDVKITRPQMKSISDSYPASGISRIVVYLNGGHDHAIITGTVAAPVILDGGTGDDQLQLGTAQGIALGGPGRDVIIGGSGRNILIGGDDEDMIVSQGDQDILIGGRTAYDNGLHQWRKVAALADEWLSDVPILDRMDHLRTGGGPFLNGARLVAGETVFDDAAVDKLNGGRGRTWLFADPTDRIGGK